VSAWKLEWERAWGRPAGQGRIRRENADFEVAEALGWEPTGTGEHLLLYLEKDGDNTDYVARAVAELAGCRDYDVGYCGRKDRQAITRQWFSVPCPTEREQALIGRVSQRWRVQDQHRHERKLRRGQHEYNHFRIRVRSLDADQALLAERWRQVTEQGCPNYFGPQRFGWGGSNLDAAAELNPDSLRNPRKRARSGMLLSAARSWLFNEWLEQRMRAGDWQEVAEGDPDPEPSGPLFGDDACGAREPLAGRELAFAGNYPHFMALFRATRMQPARRALAVKPLNCALDHDGDSVLLTFTLPRGAFATAILNELLIIDDDVRNS
jgi:tRNA pseudouridine13 synthase